MEKALDEKGKQLDKDEKKQIKDAVSALRKLVFRKQPEKMDADDLSAVRGAMENVRQVSSHLMSL